MYWTSCPRKLEKQKVKRGSGRGGVGVGRGGGIAFQKLPSVSLTLLRIQVDVSEVKFRNENHFCLLGKKATFICAEIKQQHMK